MMNDSEFKPYVGPKENRREFTLLAVVAAVMLWMGFVAYKKE